MIHECDNHCFGVLGDLFKSTSDRNAHLAVRIGIGREANFRVLQMRSNLVFAMTNHDYDVANTCPKEISDAAFDHRLITEGKQRLESSHATRSTGGEENSGDVIHSKKITTKTRRHKHFKPEMVKSLSW